MDISKKIKNLSIGASAVTIVFPCAGKAEQSLNLVSPERSTVSQMYKAKHAYKTYNLMVDRPTGNSRTR